MPVVVVYTLCNAYTGAAALRCHARAHVHMSHVRNVDQLYQWYLFGTHRYYYSVSFDCRMTTMLVVTQWRVIEPASVCNNASLYAWAGNTKSIQLLLQYYNLMIFLSTIKCGQSPNNTKNYDCAENTNRLLLKFCKLFRTFFQLNWVFYQLLSKRINSPVSIMRSCPLYPR